jgi:phosphoserine phosphatase RsbU/P
LNDTQTRSITAHIPVNDPERLAAVRRYDVLDTPPDGSFDRITALAASIFDVPIALVTIVDEDRIWFKSRFGLDGIGEIPRDPGLCASAICHDEAYIVGSARTDPRALANPLVAGEFGLQFYAAVPLRTHDGFNLGTLCLLDREPRDLSAGDTATLETLAHIVMDEMELRLQAIGTVSRERALRTESQRVARTLQGAMLPQAFPAIAGIAFDAVYAPASAESEIGGDWYDAFAVDPHNLVISVGDVAGHGLHAATLMGKLRQSLRAFTLAESSPRELLRLLDDVLRREHEDTVVTAFVGWIELGTRTLRYANAGHPPPLCRLANGEIVEVSGTGAPLGLRSPQDIGDATLRIEPKSVLLLYTDGLIESTRDLIDGEQRLRAALRREDVVRSRPAQTLHDTVLAGGSFDDVAIMTVTFD